jgi:hypothetical protein
MNNHIRLLITSIFFLVPAIVQTQINITVNWGSNTGISSTSKSYAINCNRYFDPAVTGNANYISNLQYLGAKFFRFHDWAVLGWEIPGESGWMTASEEWNASKVVQALNPYKNNFPGAEIMMNIPMWPKKWFINSANSSSGFFGRFANAKLQTARYDDFANWCASLVTICKNNGFNIKYWELPNELEELYPWWNPTEYNKLLDIYKRAAKKMKEADPSIKVGGMAFANNDGGVEFLDGVASQTFQLNGSNVYYIDFYTEHKYPAGEGSGLGTVWQGQLITNQVVYADVDNVVAPVISSMVDLAGGYGRPLETFLDELNISYGDDDPAIIGYQAAVYFAMAYFKGVQNGVDGIHDWCDIDGNRGIQDASYVLRPRAHTTHMLNKYLIGNLVSASSSNSNIKAYAVNGSAYKAVMLVNTTQSAQNIKFTFSGWGSTPSALNTERVAPSGSGNNANFTTGSVSYTSATSSYSLPANSVTTFYVSNNGGYVPVSGITVSPTSSSISVGQTEQLTATVSPSNATNKTVSWSSSNTGVATVNSSGLVMGVSAGNATITATSQDGNKTATHSVSVTGGGGGTSYYIYSDAGNNFTPDGGSIFNYVMTVTNFTSGAAEGANYRRLAVSNHYATYEFVYASAKNKSNWAAGNVQFSIKTTADFDFFMEDFAGNRTDVNISDYISKTGNWESVTIPVSAFSGVNLSQLKGLGFYRLWKASINMSFDNLRITGVSSFIPRGDRHGAFLTENNTHVKVFPTVSTGHVTVTSSNMQGGIMSVVDQMGRVILHRNKISYTETLDLTGHKGHLILRIEKEGHFVIQKLIIE